MAQIQRCTEPMGCEALQETHASQVNSRLHYLSDKLAGIASRLEERLRPVLIAPAPCEQCEDKSIPPRRPPLFNELHTNIDVLDRFVYTINDIIDRIEL